MFIVCNYAYTETGHLKVIHTMIMKNIVTAQNAFSYNNTTAQHKSKELDEYHNLL